MATEPRSDDPVRQAEADKLCDRFEAAWRAGEEPAIESFLESLKSASRRFAFADLLRVELELIHSAGKEPDLEGYRRRFPDLQEVVASLSDPRNAKTEEQGPHTDGPITDGYVPQGAKIGNYKILSRLGEGGFGVVYLAEREKPIRSRVALKVIKPGMDSGQVIARFESERQALALMDHPNVARVFDGGISEQGQPYFVMEYVKGISLTEHCDRQRLTIKDRLELFIQVCEAVQHAHQKGIIHRDLKPTNILITIHGNQSIPKVIDFGLAKAMLQPLTERSLVTEQGQLLGTPEYMSPEQAEMTNQDIDTRADIYSLGAVLYELLTGSLPFDSEYLRSGGLYHCCRVIREEEPPIPSDLISSMDRKQITQVTQSRHSDLRELNRELKGDLDWITLRAMEKDRMRRYETANGLAADVRRYLNDEPVVARPPSTIYRFQKMVRRNKVVFTASAAVVVSLAVGLAVAVWGLADAIEQREKVQEALKFAETAERQAATERDEAERAREDAEAAGILLRRKLYQGRLSTAHSAWETGHVGQVLEVLNDLRPVHGEQDLRGFGWYYLWKRIHGEVRCFRGHAWQHSIYDLDVSPDGKTLATACSDRTVKLWDLDTGREVATFHGHKDEADSVAFSPDGKMVASGDDNGYVILWDVATQKEHLRMKGHSEFIDGLAFSPDGKTLASAANDSFVKVWRVADGAEVSTLTGHQGRLHKVQFSPDGTLLASSGSDDTVKLWDVSTWSERATLPNIKPTDLAFSPDGKTLATVAGASVKLWNMPIGDFRISIDSQAGIYDSLAFSPDGTTLAAGSVRGSIELWDPSTGEQRGTIKGHTGVIDGLRYTPHGRLVAAAGSEAKLWNPTTQNDYVTLKGHKRGVTAVSFSSDGKKLATGSLDKTVKLWDVATCKECVTLEGHAYAVASLAFCPGRNMIATGSRGEKIKVWDVTTGKELTTLERDAAGPYYFSAAHYPLAFSPDGRFLAAASHSRAKLWDVGTWQQRSTLHLGYQVQTLAFSPKGKRLAIGNNRISFWDPASSELLARLPRRPSLISAMAYSSDGKDVVTGDRNGKIRLWDVLKGEERFVFQGHSSKITSAALSSDGSLLATASYDATVKLWDVATGQEELRLAGDDSLESPVAFSPKGDLLATVTGRIVKLWDVTVDPNTDEHPDVARFLVKRGFEQNEHKEIERLLRQATDLLSKTLGDEHVYVADAMWLLAGQLWSQGEYGEALPSLERALMIKQKALGIGHADSAYEHTSLAMKIANCPDILIRDSSTARALEFANVAVEVKPEYHHGWRSLGCTQYRAGNWTDSIAAYETAREISSEENGYDMLFLAMANWRLGNSEEARELFRRGSEWNFEESDLSGRCIAEAAELLGISTSTTDNAATY
jgi:WD40 repeat protein/serine/threonine protein kinase